MPQWLNERKGKESLARERRPFPYNGSQQMLLDYHKLLNEELREGIIVQVPHQFVKWWSPTFLVPKKNGEYRKVLNCRRLNAEMKDLHFKMEDVRTVKDVILPGDYAVSIDIKSAYSHVSVHPSLRPYLGFSFEGKSYVYNAMPFGYKDAPRVFTRIMRGVIWNVRKFWNVRCVQYLDDLLFLDQNPANLERIVGEIIPWLDNLGWTVSEKKSDLIPKQVFTYLGWHWDTQLMCVALSEEKKDNVLFLLHQWEKKMSKRKLVLVRELASLIGILSATRPQHCRASLYLVKMNRLKCATVNREGWDGRCFVTHMICGELHWWQKTIATNEPSHLSPLPLPDGHMWVDASPSGWGASLKLSEGNFRAFGLWDENVSNQTSNFREMLAVSCAIRSYLSRCILQGGLHLRIHSDNTSTVFNIQRKAAARNLYHPLRQLFNLCIANDIEISAIHVKGEKNFVADSLSRLSRSGDYSLKPGVFSSICEHLHIAPDVDVLSASKKAQLPHFFSPLHTDSAPIRDGMSVSWKEFVPFLHPPISLIGRCLRKILTENTAAVLVLPHWKGQSWSTLLDKMSKHEFIIGKSQNVLQAGKIMNRKGDKLPPGYIVAHWLSPPYVL
jgi:hypothetical protein